MDVLLVNCLFGSIFLLPVGALLLLVPRWRKLGLGLVIIALIGLIVSGIGLYLQLRSAG
jgi:hypothetical protein